MNIALTRFKNTFAKREVELSNAKANNEKLIAWREQLSNINAVYTSLEEMLQDFKGLKKFITLARNKYSTTALAILEADIKTALDLVFPDENYQVRILFSDNGGDATAILQIGTLDPTGASDTADNGIEWDLPILQNGGLCKQVIQFAAVSSILYMLGCRDLYLDEAFNSGDSTSLGEMAPFFLKLFSDRFQIIGIEHKSEIFSGIPYRAIRIVKERGDDGCVRIQKCEDIGMLDMNQISSMVRSQKFDSHDALMQLREMTEATVSAEILPTLDAAKEAVSGLLGDGLDSAFEMLLSDPADATLSTKVDTAPTVKEDTAPTVKVDTAPEILLPSQSNTAEPDTNTATTSERSNTASDLTEDNLAALIM